MKFSAMAFMAMTLTLVSCEDDPIVPPVETNVAPTIELQLPSGTAVDSINLTEQGVLGTPSEIIIVATDDNDNLQTISYQRDGVDVALQSFDVRPDSSSNFVRANPAIVDSTGFTRTFFVVSPSEYATSTTYTFTVRDVSGEEASADIVISQPEEIVSTPLERTVMGALFNQAGPTGTGGVDLEDGLGTASMSTLAELRDLGIDAAIPTGTENWRRQIAPVNNTMLRQPSSTWISENPFAGVDSKEAVLDAFNSSAVDITESSPVVAGTIFSVYDARDGRYYLVEVENVIAEADSNDDRYILNIKY